MGFLIYLCEMKKGEIYYLSDQLRVKFFRIFNDTVWAKDENWIFCYKSLWLHEIFEENYPNTCDKIQFTKSHFQNLLNKISYTGMFRGCIRIPEEILISISKGEKIDMEKYPFLEKINGNYLCKKVSKSEFRNLKLDILEL